MENSIQISAGLNTPIHCDATDCRVVTEVFHNCEFVGDPPDGYTSWTEWKAAVLEHGVVHGVTISKKVQQG